MKLVSPRPGDQRHVLPGDLLSCRRPTWFSVRYRSGDEVQMTRHDRFVVLGVDILPDVNVQLYSEDGDSFVRRRRDSYRMVILRDPPAPGDAPVELVWPFDMRDADVSFDDAFELVGRVG